MTSFGAQLVRLLDYGWRVLRLVFLLFPLCVIARIRQTVRPHDLWLFAERDGDACDNAFALFAHVRRSHPEVRAVYAADPTSPRFHLVEAVGPWVRYGSLRHYWLFASSRVAVSTHVYGASPLGVASKALRWVQPDRCVCFIRHGAGKDHSAPYSKARTGVDLLTTTGRPEYEYFKRTTGYEAHELVLTGMCRYDQLRADQPPARQILFMPTFRKELHQIGRLPAGAAKQAFERSLYYRAIVDVLGSKELARTLDAADARLLFLPHPRMLALFADMQIETPTISVATDRGISIPSAIQASSALLTDFSSVAFDFAVMARPVIYYQFDTERYRDRHYKAGEFDYLEHGFGPVVGTGEEAVQEIAELLRTDFAVSERYVMRERQYFAFGRDNNCTRTLNAIVSHPKLKSDFGYIEEGGE